MSEVFQTKVANMVEYAFPKFQYSAFQYGKNKFGSVVPTHFVTQKHLPKEHEQIVNHFHIFVKPLCLGFK